MTSAFISHRAKDAAVAQQIFDILDGNMDMEFFISLRIEMGIDWRKEIAEKLNQANFLILLFTDPDENWGWCLYETGFFDALTKLEGAGQQKRIFCLHNPDSAPPDPIANLETIAVDGDNVGKWLKQLFAQTNQKPSFVSKIPGMTAAICDAFGRTRKELYSTDKLTITVRSRNGISADDLPDDTVIAGDRALIAEVFRKNADKVSWAALRSWPAVSPKTEDANTIVLKEISRAVYCLAREVAMTPLQGVIFVGDGPRRYRPVIRRAYELQNGEIQCEVLLVEDVGGQLQNVDPRLGALLTSFRMAIRIRWEVIKPFLGQVAPLAAFDARKLRFDLQTCLNNIFTEAEYRGVYSAQDIYKSFDQIADQTAIVGMATTFPPLYARLWRAIGFADPGCTFGEVSAAPLSPEDIAALEGALRDLEAMNRQFLEIAARRTRDLVEEETSGNGKQARPPTRGAA